MRFKAVFLFFLAIASTGCISTKQVAGYRKMEKSRVIFELNTAINSLNGGKANEKGIFIKREEATHQTYDPITQTTKIYGKRWEEFFPYAKIEQVSLQTSPLGIMGLFLIDPTMISAPAFKSSAPSSNLNQDGLVLIQPTGILRLYFPFYLFKPQYVRARSCARLLETARLLEMAEAAYLTPPK